MNSVYFLKNDLGCWLKKNTARLIALLVLCVFAVIIAVRNALVLEDVQTVFCESGSALFGFLRGDVSIINVLLRLLVEWTLMLGFILLSSYNNVTVYLSCTVVIYKSYTAFYNVVIVVRCCMFSAIFFCIAYVLVAIVSLLVLAFVIINLIDSQCRFCYGIKELKNAACSLFPTVFFIALIILLELVLLCFSKIFI